VVTEKKHGFFHFILVRAGEEEVKRERLGGVLIIEPGTGTGTVNAMVRSFLFVDFLVSELVCLETFLGEKKNQL